MWVRYYMKTPLTMKLAKDMYDEKNAKEKLQKIIKHINKKYPLNETMNKIIKLLKERQDIIFEASYPWNNYPEERFTEIRKRLIKIHRTLNRLTKTTCLKKCKKEQQ